MTVLEVGVFAASRATHAATRRCLTPRLERLREIWPRLTMRVRHYVVPDDGLGFVVLAGETRPVGGRTEIVAGAAAPDPERAAAIFCSEVAERAACAWYRGNGPRPRSTVDQLVASGEAVFDCVGYLGSPLASRGTGFASFDRRRAYEWVSGEGLATGSPVWIPLPLVSPAVPPEERFCEMTTIGCAAASDVEVATARGFEELRERHVLRVAWFVGAGFEAVPPPPEWGILADADRKAGWTTRFYRTALTGGREVALVYGRHRVEPLYTVGSGCGGSWAEACEHAVRETVQGRLVAWLYRHNRPVPDVVRSFPDHLFCYCRPERIGFVDRFFDRFATVDSGVSRASDCFDDGAVRSGAVRLRLLEEPDLSVVRVLSPALQPLEARHDAARIVGAWRHAQPARALETAPHPFP